MNFIDTIVELREKTKKIDVVAIDGYTGRGLKDIGVRCRTVFSEDIEDPVIDHMPFMICGDIYDVMRKRISNIDDLEWRIDRGFVTLRAIPGYDPDVVIDLGDYDILAIGVPDTGDRKVYRLSLERK